MRFPTRGRHAGLRGEFYRRTIAAIPARPAKPATAIWVASLLPEELVPLPPEPPAGDELGPPPLEDVLAAPIEDTVEPPV